MTKTIATDAIDHSKHTANTLVAIGNRIRDLRRERELTLTTLSEMTGLSASMLSLVERGKTSASIGTLIVISSALGVQMSEFLADQAVKPHGNLVRLSDQQVYDTVQGVRRRILSEDPERGIEIAINIYQPDTGNSPTPVRHAGYEYGFLIEGELNVEIDGAEYLLQAGDLISYQSTLPHRLWNNGQENARTMWINLNRYVPA